MAGGQWYVFTSVSGVIHDPMINSIVQDPSGDDGGDKMQDESQPSDVCEFFFVIQKAHHRAACSKHNDDDASGSNGDEEGQTADGHQQLSQRRSSRAIKISTPFGLKAADQQPAKPRKAKRKAFHAPYQKLMPIVADHIQDVDMEESGSITATMSDPSCVDVPVSIFSSFA
jgi:hypothetical protein